jgi:hypothetical protein
LADQHHGFITNTNVAHFMGVSLWNPTNIAVQRDMGTCLIGFPIMSNILKDVDRARFTPCFMPVIILDDEPKHPTPVAILSLLAISVTGLVLQTLTVLFPTRQIIEIYPSIAWVSV